MCFTLQSRSLLNVPIDCQIHRESKSIFLGRRIDEPAKNEFWIMGGRMKVGDTPQQSLHRVLKREIGLDTNPSDFHDLELTISYVWEKRSQEPVNHGCHMVGLYFAYFVDDRVRIELEELNSNANFSEFGWIPLVDITENEESYHLGIRKVARKIGCSRMVD